MARAMRSPGSEKKYMHTLACYLFIFFTFYSTVSSVLIRPRGKALKKITYTLLKKINKKIRKIKKNQLQSQEKIKNQKNLVRLFFKCFTCLYMPLGYTYGRGKT